GVVHGHDKIEFRPLRQPSVLLSVLEYQHARQGSARPLLAVGRALRRLCDQAALLQHALGPGVASDKRRPVRHRPALDRFVEVLGGEIEAAGAELLKHPRNLVDRCPPARRPPAPAVHDPLCPVRLIGVAQPAKVPLAHPQQLRRLHAAQLPRLMQPNRIDDPGHSDLRQHAIPPAQTGQIVCYQTRTYRVPPTWRAFQVATRRMWLSSRMADAGRGRSMQVPRVDELIARKTGTPDQGWAYREGRLRVALLFTQAPKFLR